MKLVIGTKRQTNNNKKLLLLITRNMTMIYKFQMDLITILSRLDKPQQLNCQQPV